MTKDTVTRRMPKDWADHAAREVLATIVGQSNEREAEIAAIFRRRHAESVSDVASTFQDTWTAEEWQSLSWLEKHQHNYPAWEAHFAGKAIQWWLGGETGWKDEPRPAPDYVVVGIEHPQRIKPVEVWFDLFPSPGDMRPALYRWQSKLTQNPGGWHIGNGTFPFTADDIKEHRYQVLQTQQEAT